MIFATFGNPPQHIMLGVGEPQEYRRVFVPIKDLKIAEKTSLWEVWLDAKGLSPRNAKTVLNLLKQKLADQSTFHATLISGVVTDSQIRIVITGSPFPWPLLLAAIPLILALLGIALTGVSVWQILGNVPVWAWALLAGGVLLLYFSPSISNAFKGLSSEYKEHKEGGSSSNEFDEPDYYEPRRRIHGRR
jgi:hypothetical protein